MKTPGGILYATMLTFLYLLGFLHLSQAQTTTTVTAGSNTTNVTTTSTATTAPEAATSNITEVPTTDSTQFNATNVTVTETTATTTTAAATTNTSVPTTSTPSVDLKHNIETSVFSLRLAIGPDNTSDIQYLNQTLTKDEILEKMTKHFLRVGPGIQLESSAAAPSSSSFSLRLDFLASRIHNSTSGEIMVVLKDIDGDINFSAPNMNDTQLTVEKFIQSTRDVCAATGVCPPGFTCHPSGCEHMCRRQDCSSHGTCAINVLSNSSVEVVCKCEETYSTKYGGDHCESSSMGSDMIIAIVAGVLGAACLVFFLLFIIACVLYYRKRTNFNMSYDDFFSSTYHNTPVKVNDINLNGVHS